MNIDSEEFDVVIRYAQRAAAETVRQLAAGTGGAAIGIPVHRVATVQGTQGPGGEAQIAVDGEGTTVPAVNATGFSVTAGDRVLVLWHPPHGVHIISKLSGEADGLWTPTISGTGVTDAGTAVGHYTVVGGRVHAWGNYTLAGAASWGTGGVSVGGLPFQVLEHADSSNLYVRGFAELYDANNLRRYTGRWRVPEGYDVGQVYYENVFAAPGAAYMVPITSTAPVAEGTDDSLSFEIVYDIN